MRDRMGIMAIGEVIILSTVLLAQTLSAPSGCIESCNFYQQTSYQNRHTGGYQDHAALVQGSTNLNEHDYARPGNWTERNQYNTDGGHGKVHEERGQYVEGSKKVRYFKKNFTSAYGNVDGLTDLGGQPRYDSLHIPSSQSQHLESQVGAHELGQTITKESGYSRIHNQQSSTRLGGKSERLEDFGEYGGHSQHGVNVQTVETATPQNWNRVDSYRTDGGRGQVFEEEGQYVTGPKKVRYYKKNYTSSYSASGDTADSANLDNLHSELHRNVQGELDKFRREFHHQTASTTGLTQEAVHSFHGNDLQTAESENTYGHQLSGYHRVYPSTGTVRHYTDQQQTETFADTGRQQSVRPVANTYGQTESQRTYHETYVSRAHPAPQPSSHLSSSYPVQVTGGNYQTAQGYSHSDGHRHLDEVQRAEISSAHQSGLTQNRLFTDRAYNPNPTYTNVHPGRRDETRHYQEEHWQSSSSHGGNLAPERSTDLTGSHGTSGSRIHYDRDAYNEHRSRHHSSAQGYDSHGGSSYSSGYGISSGQKLVAPGSSLDLGRTAHSTHGADCTEETHQQYQHETSYHRKYKRDDRHVLQDQEFEPDLEKLDLTHASDQQAEDFTQHDEELTQQTEGQLEFGQQTDDQYPHDFTQQSEQFAQESDHLAQQTSDKLNFGQQIVGDQRLEDLTQQNEQKTEGQLEFGQQTFSDQQHNEQFMQQDSNDQTQQTGKLEFDQQIVGNQRLEDLTQQNEQKTEGQLEFGQQTFSDQQHNEQFMQQDSNDQTQQIGKLEFDQQIVGNQRLENLMQQNEQKTEGQLEFGQQTFNDHHLTQSFMPQDSNDQTQQTDKLDFNQQIVGNQRLENLMQQNEQKTEGQLEFGQQTFNDHHLTQSFMPQDYEDLTQQSGKLEFDHQTDDQQVEDLKQQTEQLETVGFDYYTQQAAGKLEFGQQTVNDQHLADSNKPGNPKNQHLEEFEEFPQQGRHNDFTQQTTGQLEFGSSNSKIDHHSDDFTQNEDLTQQMGEFGNFPQSGHLEWPREQSQNPNWPGYDTQHPEHYSQQDGWNTDNLSQQSAQYSSNDNNKQQAEWQLDMSQQTQQDFTHQQTDDDQQLVRKPAPKPKPRPRYQQHDSTILSHTDKVDANLDDIFEPIEVNPETDPSNLQLRPIQYSGHLTYPRPEHHRSDIPSQNPSTVFDNEKENMDRLHWVHKSNDATVGLQWHYTYHPSDLTNIEGSHNSYYPHHNVNSQQTEDDTHQQQQSRPFDFSQQETEDQTSEDTHIPQTSQVQRNQHDQQLGSFQQVDTSHFDQFNQNSEQAPLGVIPLQNQQQTANLQNTEQTEHNKMESRILEAYGGGPYDASRNDDIYRRVRPNPSATLPPLPDNEDPWDIREKPREIIPWMVVNSLPVASTSDNTATTTTEKTEITTQIMEATTMEAPPSFWSRLGHKITTTYDKAKEKAKEYFG